MNITEHAAALEIIRSLVAAGKTAPEIADLLTKACSGRDHAFRADLRDLLDWQLDRHHPSPRS